MRVIKLLILTLLALVVFDVVAYQSMRGRLEGYSSSQSYESGDKISMRMTVWPTTRSTDEFRGLQGRFGDELYLLEIVNIKRSQNNHEAILLDGVFVLLPGFRPGQASYIEFDGTFIELSLPNIEFTPTELPDGVFEYLSFSIVQRRNLMALVTAFVLFLFIASYFLRKKYQQYEKRKKREENIKYWNGKFIAAKERQDYEEIVSREKEWGEYIAPSPPLDSFIKEVKVIQYKRDWTESDFKKVRSDFSLVQEEIREK